VTCHLAAASSNFGGDSVFSSSTMVSSVLTDNDPANFYAFGNREQA